MPPLTLVTGGTGLVGGRVAAQLAARGDAVRCLVRPGANVSSLTALGVELAFGDLTDAESVRKAAARVNVVIHCAAKVGDWGPYEPYRVANVDGTRNLLDAVAGTPLTRFVHVSSSTVYAARHHTDADESAPLATEFVDGYSRSKAEAEAVVWEYSRRGVPVAVLRPGVLYGQGDTHVLPRLVARLRERTVIYIGRGRRALNTTFVGNVADACLLAAENPAAVGEAFNVNDGEFVSKRRFVLAVAAGLHLPQPFLSVPLWLAWRGAAWREWAFRRKGRTDPPRATRANVRQWGLDLGFSVAKARRLLGYGPRTTFAAGMAETLAWYESQVGKLQVASQEP